MLIAPLCKFQKNFETEAHLNIVLDGFEQVFYNLWIHCVFYFTLKGGCSEVDTSDENIEKITFINRALGNEITICKNEDNIYIRDERKSISDSSVRDFIWKIGRSFPNVASYEHLMNGIAAGGSDDKTEAQRIFYKIKKFLEANRSGQDLFENVRNSGYRVTEKWEIKSDSENKQTNEILISELWKTVNRSIEHSRNWPIEHDKSGLSYIRAKSDYAMSTFRDINSLYWEILEHSSRNSNSLEILQLREPLFRLMTYLLFWRVGDRLEDEQWRSDYEKEITLLTKQIAVIYENI